MPWPKVLRAVGPRASAAAQQGANIMARDVIEIVNDLIQLDRNATRAYEQAISACEHTQIRDTLARFRADHERHIQDLGAQLRALGGVPEVGQDLKGKLIEGFTAITSQGDQSALLAMRGNEELTNLQYASALEHAGLTAETRAVIERNHDDEKRHLAWIKDALSRKVWDKAA
jgi:uncharacterized protein (TIGR02284 family)